jgi:hypothetical protein
MMRSILLNHELGHVAQQRESKLGSVGYRAGYLAFLLGAKVVTGGGDDATATRTTLATARMSPQPSPSTTRLSGV